MKYPRDLIVRCRTCEAYLSPFSRFLSHGRQWDCLICKTINASPEDYFTPDGSMPKAPELSCLEFDIVLPDSFSQTPPMPCTYVFIVDCSFASASSGFLQGAYESIKLLIENSALPGLPRTEVALIGFGGAVHLFDLGAEEPKIVDLVVNPDEVFLPLPKGRLLVNLEDSTETFLKSLEALLKIPNHTRGNVIRSALTVAVQLLTGRGGKIVLFNGHNNLADSARPKDFILNPVLPFYREMVKEMGRNEISIDLFLAASEYSNISAISELAKYSGGSLFFYPDFVAYKQSEKLRNEVWKSLTACTIWEGAIKVRTNPGWVSTGTYGNFITKVDKVAAFGSTNTYKTLAFEFDLDVQIASSAALYVQAAILHTTSEGHRVIRVINRSYNLASEVSDVVNGIDVDTTVNLLARKAVGAMGAANTPRAGRSLIEEAGSNLLMMAKRFGFEGTYYLAASLMGLNKHPVLADENQNFNLLHDLHSYRRFLTLSYGSELSSLMAYPRLYAISLQADPQVLKSSSKEVACEGVYLLDTGLDLLLWIGKF